MVTHVERRVRTHSWGKISEEHEDLVAQAGRILRRNDMGGWTRAAPWLYPHQWSWDSAFIAVGLAHLDTRRAAQELRTLFAHQWKTGKVPHIVFNPKAPPHSYYPGADHWACAAASPDAPLAPPYTSCLCQPPVHAIAALRIWEVAGREDEKAFAEATDFLREIYPRLLAWHRYLATFRDPERSGLVTIYHPWASGTDNSPRWDGALAADEALLEIAEVVEAPDEERELVEGWAGRGRRGLEKCWDEKLNLCLDYDLRADKPLQARTVAGFAAPLIAGRQSPERLAVLLGELDST